MKHLNEVDAVLSPSEFLDFLQHAIIQQAVKCVAEYCAVIEFLGTLG
jgi:hypothetical protein